MTDSILLVEKPDKWSLLVAGRQVTRCLIDHAFTMELLLAHHLVQICLEGEFALKTSETSTNLAPGRSPQEICGALAVLHKQVEAVDISKQGDLEIRFSDGVRLVARPDSDFEAWQVNSTDGLLVVSGPGSRLSIWLPPS